MASFPLGADLSPRSVPACAGAPLRALSQASCNADSGSASVEDASAPLQWANEPAGAGRAEGLADVLAGAVEASGLGSKSVQRNVVWFHSLPQERYPELGVVRMIMVMIKGVIYDLK